VSGVGGPASAHDADGARRTVVSNALRPFTIPNGITLVRLALTPFCPRGARPTRLALVVHDRQRLRPADGRSPALRHAVAWRHLDPIADKVLLVTAYVRLTWPGPNGAIPPGSSCESCRATS
jgi:hypothetical protein